MASLFRPWTDHLVRLLLILAAVLVVGTPILLMAWVRTPYVTGETFPLEQPIQFDHRHHVRDDGINCLYCHTTAMTQASAGMPPTDLCLSCHGQIWNDSPLLEPLWNSRITVQPIRWRRVNALPDFVFFNHAAHTTHGIGCESCHGRVDRMARVYQAVPLTMGWCVDCHSAPERHLRPVEDVTTMGFRPERPQAELGRELKGRYGVRELTHCTTCHR